jgi:hypothetical protein
MLPISPQVTISASPGFNVTAVASVRLTPTGRLLRIQVDKPIPGTSTLQYINIYYYTYIYDYL